MRVQGTWARCDVDRRRTTVAVVCDHRDCRNIDGGIVGRVHPDGARSPRYAVSKHDEYHTTRRVQ